MKQLLKRWLGIDALDNQVVTPTELRRLIGEAVIDALSNKPDFEHHWMVPLSQIENGLTMAIRIATNAEIGTQFTKLFSDHVGSEAFIDSVVERIRKKQLT